MTFSKMANFGCFSNRTSVAAMKVSPEQPLSSISIRNLERSIEKFLHDVPATNMLVFGIVCS